MGGSWDHNNDWKWSEFDMYVQLNEHADVPSLELKLPKFLLKYARSEMEEMNYKEELHLQSLTDIHLKSPKYVNERQVHGSEQTVYFLIIIGGSS